MNESEFDFEFDFLPERPTAAPLEDDEQLLWEDSDPELPRRREHATAPPPHVVMRRRVAATAAVGLLLLIIVVVVATSGGGGGGGSYGSYVSDVSPIAADSQQTGAALGSLSRSSIGGRQARRADPADGRRRQPAAGADARPRRSPPFSRRRWRRST